MGLNENFSHIRGQILLIDPLPSINKVFSLIVQEERQRMISSSSTSFNPNTTALLTRTIPPTRFAGNRPSYPRKDRSICSHCNVPGHTIEKCYRLHGFPPAVKLCGFEISSLTCTFHYNLLFSIVIVKLLFTLLPILFSMSVLIST